MAESNGSGVGFTSYEVDADNAFLGALNKARKSIDDLRPAFQEIARDFYKSQKAIFILKGPGQYPDLSPKYKVLKERTPPKGAGFAYPILKYTGKLEKAATKADGPGNITVIGKQSAQFGVLDSVVPYAKYHQSDGPRKGSPSRPPFLLVPLRKFLFIGPESKKYASDKALTGRVERYTGIFEVWTIKLSKKSGLGDK